MNFNSTKWAIDQLPSLPKTSASTRLVFINLANRHNETQGAARPGVDRIASDLCISDRTVQRALRTLEKIGIVRTEFRYNKPSWYFLNFNFVRAGVGDRTSPKIKVEVTKSHLQGEEMSPLEVTKSHPNKQEDKLLNKQQQTDVVVFEKLVWPTPLDKNQQTACEFFLAGQDLPVNAAQQFADEMAGNMRIRSIRNPVGWLKNMVGRYRTTGFCFAFADAVAASRAGRAAQAARESIGLPAVPSSPAARLPLSEVGRAALAAAHVAIGRLPKPAQINAKPSSISVETAPILSGSTQDCTESAQL